MPPARKAGQAAFYRNINKKEQTMKHILLMALPVLVVATSCNVKMPPVPPSNRTVVEPGGSSRSVKPWNETTKQEGDAVLGPLSDVNRR